MAFPPLVIDTTTAMQIPTSSQLYKDWRAAEEKALRESEARKAAEAEIARLRAELDRRDRG